MRSPTTQQEFSRWIGRVLRDKWRIDARIARGGVGTVYAATHRNNGMTVAIKVLHPEFSRDADTRSRFLQEGYAANQVNHPGVVRILDDDVTEEGLAFLVMELLEGELLEKRRIRKGGRLPLAEVYEIADQLLDVIAAAHDKGIVHRDIKPDNLFLTGQGRLKVLDFGFAQMRAAGFRTEQTATGYLLGTPGFMSPEQAVGNRAQVDAKTDIWAIGATLFTLISGEPVHEGESAAEMLVAAANYPARPIAEVAPGVPPKLAQIVDKALAFDKADRWASTRAMQAALRAVPGRVSVGGAFESGRRSVPDDHPASFDDRTMTEQVEELDPAELEDAQPSWQTDNERTVAIAATASSTSPSEPPVERTMIMDTGQHPAQPQMPAQPATRAPLGSGFHNAPQAFVVADPRASRADGMMYVAGPARPAPPAPPLGSSRVLTFVIVAVVSMVIVVVTGLIILAGAD